MEMINRRQAIRKGGGFGLGGVAATLLVDRLLAPRAAGAADSPWQAALGRSLPKEHDYRPRIEGVLPAGLRGSLFRNGPGLFERDGLRKRNLLDGDGMIRAYDFSGGGVRYRNRFVRTEKFKREQAAGAYETATWTTRAPGGMLANIGGGEMLSQAGIAVALRDGELWALDEIGAPYALDRASLETLGTRPLGGDGEAFAPMAHTKHDPETNEWILASKTYGREMTLGVLVLGPDGDERARFEIPSPRQCYIHDFLVTREHIVFNLHPMGFSPLGFLAGAASFIDSLSWRREEGGLMLVVRRDGAGSPIQVEAPPSFMWHGLNAWDDGDGIVADFVGYDSPDRFNGEDAVLRTIMQGRLGKAGNPGKPRRQRIPLTGGAAREDVVSELPHEFPMLDPAKAMTRHRVGYFATGRPGDWFYDGLAAIDFETGDRNAFQFPGEVCVTEPVFARATDGSDYLLAESLDGGSGRGFLAVFRTDALSDGPVAKLWLEHHIPLSFHGIWAAA